jgi:hypothetical protein
MRLLILVNWITLGYVAAAGTIALVRIKRADVGVICEPRSRVDIVRTACWCSATIETSQMRKVEHAYVTSDLGAI